MASEQSQVPKIFRFGVFELDVRAGELRKNGMKLKLQEQPFQVLCALLEHPGELVTREELRNRLWPADTFVDFDHGLNAAIKRLRDALGESADAPVFIETMARRGYRFIAPVDRSPGPVEATAIDHQKQPKPRFARPWVALALLVALSLALVIWGTRRNGRIRWARDTAIPEIIRLAGKGEDHAAFALAYQAEQVIPNDPTLLKIWPDISLKFPCTRAQKARMFI